MAAEADVDEVGSGRSPEGVDRLMVGACAAIWLVLLVVSVIAVVALVNLGRGHRGLPESSSGLLYAIIGVSAVIIIGAVALLLRARRDAQQREEEQTTPAPTPAETRAEAPKPTDRPQTEARTEKIRVFGSVVDPSVRPLPESSPVPSARSGAVDRVWLRGTVSIAAAVGLALIGVASAAHQLAVGHSTAAIVALAVAGLVTLAMPAVLIIAGRKLSEVFGEEAGGAESAEGR